MSPDKFSLRRLGVCEVGGGTAGRAGDAAGAGGPFLESDGYLRDLTWMWQLCVRLLLENIFSDPM